MAEDYLSNIPTLEENLRKAIEAFLTYCCLGADNPPKGARFNRLLSDLQRANDALRNSRKR
jgi:hypothetical protein